MTSTPAEHSDRLYRRFARFARRVRRRAWTIVFMRYWLRAATICAVLGAAVHLNSDVGLSVVIEGGALVSLIAATVFSFLRRRMVDAYIATVDRRYDAAGRIIVAAEFLRSREPPDAFRKLAIEDAAEWISKHPRRGPPWTLGRARRPAIGVALCIAATMLVGCESPQPTARRKPATEPDVAPPGLAERPQHQETPTPTTGDYKPQPEHGEDGAAPGQKTAGARPGEAGTAPGETPQPGAGVQPIPTQSEDAAEGAAPKPPGKPTPETVPEPAKEGEGTRGQEGRRERPDDAPEPESGPPGGRQAGTEAAEKKEDNREVDAPEDDVQAPEVDDDTPGVGPETEGIGEELTEGAVPPPQTRPVTPEDYRDARRQDLTRERVSPARRALIERYFQNLRQPTRRPTSQPASRPTSQPARKARQP